MFGYSTRAISLFPSYLFTLHGVRQRRITKSISPPNEAFTEDSYVVFLSRIHLRDAESVIFEESPCITQLWAHHR
jgi:hypothetical protein